jgi:hypothetical protein
MHQIAMIRRGGGDDRVAGEFDTVIAQGPVSGLKGVGAEQFG